MNCPNTNTKEWKMLVSQVGERLANMAFVANGYEYPNVTPITEIKKAIGFKTRTERFEGMANKLVAYNKRNGTSHSFNHKPIYGNTFELTFHPNYLSVNAEKQRQREAVKNDDFKVEDFRTKSFENIYTPSYSEKKAGYFNEEGDFMPNENREDDVDYIVPTAASEVKAVEQKRKEKIDKEIISTRHQLKNLKSGETEKYNNLNHRLVTLVNKLENPIGGAETRVFLSEKLNSFENILSFADTQLKEVDELMTNPAISYENVQYAQRVLDLWLAAGDFTVNEKEHFILDEYEFNTPEIRAKFRIKADDAVKLQSRLSDIRKDYVTAFVKKYTSENLTTEEIYKILKDANIIPAKTLNVGRHNDAMLQAIFLAINEANLNAQIEANELWKNLDELSKKALKKSGGNFNFIKQITENNKESGRIVHRFSPEFFGERNKLLQVAFQTRDENGVIKKDPKAIERYFNWVNRNSINFDSRLLFPDSQAEDGDIPNEFVYSEEPVDEGRKERHIQELKEHLGEKGYEFYIKRQEKLIEDYKEKRRLTYNSIQSEYANQTQAERDAFFGEWVREYSPYWGLRMAEDPSARKKADKKSFYTPKGLREYTEQVPRRKVAGIDTKWYDKNFEKIEADEDLLNYYNFTVETLGALRYTLPAQQQILLGVGVLPTIQKSLMDVFSEKGMMMGITPFWDKMKQLQTTTDYATDITADVNPRTQEIEKNINVPFIEDTNARIRGLVATAKIKFEQETGKIATREDINRFREDAKDVLSKEKSWDVTRILKAYALSTLAHKHKTFIQPQIEMAVKEFNMREEAVTNKEDQHMSKSGSTKIQPKKGGLANYKSALEYFMDSTFYGTGARKIEGVSKTNKLYSSAETARKKELEALLENEEDEENQAILQSEIDKLGGFTSISGKGDAVLKFMTLKGLGWNVFSGFSNVGFGVISNLIQASDGRDYSVAHMRKAYGLAMNSLGRNLSFNTFKGINSNAIKLRTMMDQWDLLQTSNKELFDTTSKTSFGGLKRFGPFTIQERTEYLNYAPVMAAIMMEFKATDSEGKTVELWDAYGVDGKLKEGFTADDVNGKEFNEASMVQRIKRVIEMNHGDYNNALEVKKTLFGRAISQFRTWMFEGFANRFESGEDAQGNLNTDWALSYGMDEPYVRKGRYRSYTTGQLATTGAAIGTMLLPGIGTAIGATIGGLGGKFFGMQTEGNALSDVLHTIKHLARKLMFSKSRHTAFEDRFSKVDAANMRKNMTELYIMVTLMGVGLLLKALVASDDEDDKNFAVNFLLNQVTRMQTDIAFYTNPIEAERLTQNALPVFKIVTDVVKLAGDTKAYFDDDPKNQFFQSGTFKGEGKAGVHLLEFFPGTSQGIRLYRLGDKVY